MIIIRVGRAIIGVNRIGKPRLVIVVSRTDFVAILNTAVRRMAVGIKSCNLVIAVIVVIQDAILNVRIGGRVGIVIHEGNTFV